MKYIAAQAPLSGTMDTFWYMVKQLNIRDVYCLTKAKENDKEMAFVYWKPQEEASSDKFLLSMSNKVEDGITIKRDLVLKVPSSEDEMKLIHYHIEAWDDDKVPTQPEDIQALLKVVEQCGEELSADKDAKVLVHCSAGVGRTGVFICLVEIYQYLNQLAVKNKGLSIQEVCAENPDAVISIFDIVRSLREQRWGSVKSFVFSPLPRSNTSFYMKPRGCLLINSLVHWFNNTSTLQSAN